jgi:hypothetical protein
VNEALRSGRLCSVERVAQHDRMTIKLRVWRAGKVEYRIDALRRRSHAVV